MIISRSKKFVFIHIPKTAGSSVRNALRPYTRTLTGRFENTAEDFRTITERIGISAALPNMASKRSRDYRTYYTDETREIVANLIASDIKSFSYEF